MKQMQRAEDLHSLVEKAESILSDKLQVAIDKARTVDFRATLVGSAFFGYDFLGTEEARQVFLLELNRTTDDSVEMP